MSQSFALVENKLHEAEFFLERLRESGRFGFDAKCFFSGFVSAARSVTYALQASLSGVQGFEVWYESTRAKLKADPLAPFFVEIRNDLVHKGLNPLNEVTIEHLREDLFQQMSRRSPGHVLVLPDVRSKGSTVLADAVEACMVYFTSLVSVIFECYNRFKVVVDPQWYFTEENFSRMGKRFEDAVVELGLPSVWASCAPPGEGRWRGLRSQQPACQINDVFQKYLGRQVEGPDEFEPSGGSG